MFTSLGDAHKWMYSYFWEAKMYDIAIEHLKFAANLGEVQAQTLVGDTYRKAEHVKQDFVCSAQYYLMAANAGDYVAQSWMSYYYRTGTGVNVDSVLADIYGTMSNKQR